MLFSVGRDETKIWSETKVNLHVRNLFKAETSENKSLNGNLSLIFFSFSVHVILFCAVLPLISLTLTEVWKHTIVSIQCALDTTVDCWKYEVIHKIEDI